MARPWTLQVREQRDSAGVRIEQPRNAKPCGVDGTDVLHNVDFEVNPGEVLSVTVPVVPIDGTGTLDIGITWPDNVLASPSLNASLLDFDGVSSAVNFIIDTVANEAIIAGATE